MNFYARYAAVKKATPGNREKAGFEHTYGADRHELTNTTGISKASMRILSEVDFSIKLNEKLGGKFDREIDRALTILENAIKEEGALPKSVCMLAENELLPLQKEAKEYEVLYVAHAHIDMNWMWGWQETVAATLSTFRTMLNLMKEYPGFTFSQSQASVYHIVEEHDPDMMKEIQERIREGRWEITANAWVETDKNMPDTESLIRHISVTREYLHKHWGVDPDSVKIDFSPDTFGHSRFIPEIDTFGNIPYYYHCRGLQQDVTLYRFKAPSGKELLMYKEPYWYNSGINPDNGTGMVEMERRCMGLKTGMIVYGVGNHGGGATRRDIERLIEMQKWPVFPTLRFGTMHEYFRKAETVREKLPVVDHELNAIFTGCYSTQSRIKLANRRSEAALTDSEKMSALANYTLGTPFRAGQFEKAWQKTLFTHFHDIITGSNVQESREYAMGKLAEAIGYAQTEQSKAYEAITANVNTEAFITDEDVAFTRSEGAGVGYGIANYAGVPNPERGAGKTRVYTVFNSSQTDHKAAVEFTMWDYPGNIHSLEVVNAKGESVPFQLLDERPQKYWDHYYVRLLVETEVPKMGYAVYAVREKEVTAYPTFLLYAEREEQPNNEIILDNGVIRACFDTGSGLLHSLTDLATGEEMLSAPAGLNLVMTQDGGMSAWRIGRYLSVTPVTDTVGVKVSGGNLRKSVTFEQKVLSSTVKMTVSLDAGADSLSYHFEIDWREAGELKGQLPVLSYRLPLKKGAQEILNDVPAGYAYRAARQIDVPALSYGAAKVEGKTAALITDCKYGFRFANDVLSVTLINTAVYPDPYPERGIHQINLFVRVGEANPHALKEAARLMICPMVAVPTGAHKGSLDPVGCLMNFEAAHTWLSAVQIAKDNALTVRVFENGGEDDNVTLTLSAPASRAVMTDLDENELCEAEVCGNKVKFAVPAHTIRQVKIYK